jgi:hypothetical protein
MTIHESPWYENNVRTMLNTAGGETGGMYLHVDIQILLMPNLPQFK